MIKFSVLLLTAVLLQVAVSVPTQFDISGKLALHPRLQGVANHAKPVGLYGGHNITINKANYIGVILTSSSVFLGSVAIINNRWVATAAYNVYGLGPADIKIRVGSSFTEKDGSLFSATKIVRHPKYVGEWDYDIALVKLAKPLKFSGVTGKATLSSTLPKNGATVTVSGYGFTEITYGGYLQQASLPYLDYTHCKPQYPETDFTKYSLCTSKDNVGPCAYDFGSPLIYKNKLIALFSGTYACGSTTYPGVYADTTKFNSWIKEVIKKNSESEELLEADASVDEE